jgi:ABC-type lipoprotein release transport system permease subunit
MELFRQRWQYQAVRLLVALGIAVVAAALIVVMVLTGFRPI